MIFPLTVSLPRCVCVCVRIYSSCGHCSFLPKCMWFWRRNLWYDFFATLAQLSTGRAFTSKTFTLLQPFSFYSICQEMVGGLLYMYLFLEYPRAYITSVETLNNWQLYIFKYWKYQWHYFDSRMLKQKIFHERDTS